MTSGNYNYYLKLIEEANQKGDKRALLEIKKMILQECSQGDDDASRLMKQFKYSV